MPLIGNSSGIGESSQESLESSVSNAGSTVGQSNRKQEAKSILKRKNRSNESSLTLPQLVNIINLISNKNSIESKPPKKMRVEKTPSVQNEEKTPSVQNEEKIPSVQIIEKTLKRGEVITEVISKRQKIVSNEIIEISSSSDISITVGPSEETDATLQITEGFMDVQFSSGIIHDFLTLRNQSSSIKRELGGYQRKNLPRVNWTQITQGTPMTCPINPTYNSIGSFHTHPYCQNQNIKDNFYVFTFPSDTDITHYFTEPYARNGRIHFVIDALGYFILVIRIPLNFNQIMLDSFLYFHKERLKELEQSMGGVYTVDPTYTNKSIPDLLFFKFPGKGKEAQNKGQRVERKDFKDNFNEYISKNYMQQNFYINTQIYFPVTHLIQHFKYYLYSDPAPKLKRIDLIAR